MTAKKTAGTVVLATGLATATLAAGLALPVSTAAAAPAATASVTSTVAVKAMRLASAQALQPWPALRQGANSSWPKVTVRSLQYLLNARGARLTVDGIFGAKTWGALIVTVKLGSTGPAVRAVQDQANFRNLRNGHSLNVDGIFGPKTQAWVRGFQQAEGFKADGVVGPLTWQALVTESLSG